MSDWWIVLVPLYAAIALAVLGLVAFVSYCVFKASRAMGRPVEALLWLVLGLSPAILYLTMNGAADHRASNRQTQIANFARATVKGRRPDTLVSHGYMTEAEVAVLLHRYDFEQVYVFQMHGRPPYRERLTGMSFERRSDKGCEAALDDWQQGRRSWSTSDALKKCVRGESVNVDQEQLERDAVVFLQGHNTTLYRPHNGNMLYDSAYELRLRTAGRDDLIDYWEDIRAIRASSLWCVPISSKCRPDRDNTSGSISRPQFLARNLDRG